MARNCPLCGAGLYTQTVSGDLCFVCSGCRTVFRTEKPASAVAMPSAPSSVPKTSGESQSVKASTPPPPDYFASGSPSAPAVRPENTQEEDPFADLLRQTVPQSENAFEDASDNPTNPDALKLPPPFVPMKVPATSGIFRGIFVSPSTRSTLLIAFIALSIIANIANIWASNFQANILAKVQNIESIDVPELIGALKIINKVKLFLSISNILLTIFYFVWFYRVYANLRPLRSYQIEFTPGWAVGWHFVPIVNMWKPCQAWFDIWRGSDKSTLKKLVGSKATLVILWWVLMLVDVNFAYILSMMMESSIELSEIDEMVSISNLMIVSSIVSIVTLTTMMFLVIKIWKNQDARHEAIRAQDQHAAGPAFSVPSSGR